MLYPLSSRKTNKLKNENEKLKIRCDKIIVITWGWIGTNGTEGISVVIIPLLKSSIDSKPSLSFPLIC